MKAPFKVAFDCKDVEVMLNFWAVAVGYKLEDPPEGYTSWKEYDEKNNISEELLEGLLIDPGGVYPSLYFQRVPEGKVVKNRLHLDISISDGPGTPPAIRRQQTAGKVAELIAAGATQLYEIEEGGGYWVTMADPEGNEFCIV